MGQDNAVAFFVRFPDKTTSPRQRVPYGWQTGPAPPVAGTAIQILIAELTRAIRKAEDPALKLRIADQLLQALQLRDSRRGKPKRKTDADSRLLG